MTAMYSVMDELELHERIIANDPSALAAWQDATKPAIVRYVVKRGLSIDDAEEIWNDAFLATVLEAPTLERDGSSLRRFVFTVARNKAIDRRRRAPAEPPLPLNDELLTVPLGRTVLQPDERRVTALRECLGEIRERYLIVLQMKNDGYGVDEVARVLEIAADSVYKVIERAKRWMRDCVTGRLEHERT